MKALSIQFLALPTTKGIHQDYASHLTKLDIRERAKDHPYGLTI